MPKMQELSTIILGILTLIALFVWFIYGYWLPVALLGALLALSVLVIIGGGTRRKL